MRSSTKNIVLLVAVSVVPMFAFQNCSQVKFANMPEIAEKVGFDADVQTDVPADTEVTEGDGANPTNTPDTPDTSVVDNTSDDDTDVSDDSMDDKKDNVVDNVSDDNDSEDDVNEDDKDQVVDNSSDDDKSDDTTTSDNDDTSVANATCAESELTEEESANDEIVQVACNGNSGKMCAMICFQPNDNNPFVLTKKVNLKQVEDGGAWANGPKANGRVANAKSN